VRHAPRLPLDQLEPNLLTLPGSPDPSVTPSPLDWSAVFGNDHPIELEVGFGKGLFLLTESQARADVNFVGVEIEKKYVLFTATRLAKRKLPNVKVVQADARAFLRERVPPGSLHVVHVYFPDPWWKNRHHKRRVFTEEFARNCARVLRPGGILSVATDVEEYFQMMTEHLSQVKELQLLPPPEEHSPVHDLDYMTNFERKFRKLGKSIHRARYERLPS
jgi:tRNA (guanine-N7-)-methyltransferase